MVNPVTLIKQDLLTRLFVEPVRAVTPVPGSGQETATFLQGEKYQAIVESRLVNGNFKITVAGQTLQAALPETTKPGDRLNLLLIEKEPGLKFISVSDAPENQNSKDLSISTTGRFLGTLTQEGGKLPAAHTLTATTPLLSFPPDNTAPLPGLLQQSVSRSGLFYESHQAQWINGKTTLDELKQEPQARLATSSTNNTTSIDNQTRNPLSASSSMQQDIMTTIVTSSPRESGAAPGTQHTALVQQQLAVLETGQLSWRGQIWPGQLMEWDIAEEQSPSDQETGAERQWHTRLKLTLPNLGEVSAILTLDPQGVRIRLSASENSTSDLMKKHQQPLTSAMTAAGMSILTMEIEQHG